MSRRRLHRKPIKSASPRPQASEPRKDGEGKPSPVQSLPQEVGPQKSQETKTAQRCDSGDQAKPFWKSTDSWLVIGTWVLAFVSIWGLRESRNAIAISERAWVAPIDARLDEPLQRDKPIKVVVLLENSGKQPALNVQNVANGGITLPFSAEEAAREQLTGPEYQPPAECTGFPKPAGAVFVHSGTTIYPSTVQHLQASIAGTFVADQRVLSGDTTFFVHGCVTYDTIDGPHSSEYCLFLGSRIDVTSGNRRFEPCIDNNRAN